MDLAIVICSTVCFLLIHRVLARLATTPGSGHRPPAASSSALKQANVKGNFIRSEKSYPCTCSDHVLDCPTVRVVRALTWDAYMHGFDSRYAHHAGV
jgi:hypothetical protein